MTEKSQFWYTDGFTGSSGDGAAPYTQEEFRAYNDALLGEGVIAGAGNELAVSGTATPLSVATGRAQVNGFHYWNDSAASLTVTTPSVGTTGGRVVLRASWAAATVRLAVLMNTDGVATIPSLTQTSGTTWEISLASFTVTTGGVITLADTREFVIHAGAGLIQLREASGTGSSGVITFSGIQQNLSGLLLVGVARSSYAAVVDTLFMTLNNDTGLNYGFISAETKTTGAAVTSGSIGGVDAFTLGAITGSSGFSGAMDPLKIEIPNYASAVAKSLLAVLSAASDGATGASGMRMISTTGWWEGTAAINRIDLTLALGNFTTNTIIKLFGWK